MVENTRVKCVTAVRSVKRAKLPSQLSNIIKRMQREEKQLDAALSAIILRVNDLKSAIAAMIHKLETEYETINWPAFLDNYALLAGHLTGLSKILSSELSPMLRGLAVLPLLLSCEKDESLIALTEGRVTAFAHDLVPDYLRTKPEPQAEQRMLQLQHKAATLNFEAAQKQTGQFNKVVGHVWEIISKGREDWEGENLRSGIQQTHSITDTQTLVAAVGTGKGLRNVNNNVPLVVGPPRPAPPPLPSAQLPKAPSSIKTNIKAASQIHPYQR